MANAASLEQAARAQRPLVAGHTAYVTRTWQRRAAAVAVFFAICIFFLSIAGIKNSLYMNTVLVLLGVSTLALLGMMTWCGFREGAEERAGYTTLPDGYKRLLQCDPYMGHVIRLPGADYLSSKRFREIIEKTKSEASKMRAPTSQRERR
ncbi:hypothetical protein [Paenarthrobacter ilicis]|uniref:hypothetical protein n=1 Tax=Paenarthrobacter ilicis TaxID=43665 RepID=UPI003863E8CA